MSGCNYEPGDEHKEAMNFGIKYIGAQALGAFMASAGEPPPWFEPQMPECPALPGKIEGWDPFCLDENGFIEIQEVWDEGKRRRAEALNKQRGEANSAYWDWKSDKERQKRLQWPAYWGRLQLEYFMKACVAEGVAEIWSQVSK